MIWTSTFKFCPTLFIGIKSLLIKNVFQHENTLGKWLHFVPSGYILFRHPTGCVCLVPPLPTSLISPRQITRQITQMSPTSSFKSNQMYCHEPDKGK